jgi:uncharacterized protein
MMMFMEPGILPCGTAAARWRYDATLCHFRTRTTMSITMYSASAPVFKRILGNMLGWLDKAQAHADARKFDSANYLGLRLAPDMFPLVRQVQIATDAAKGCMARLAGVEMPKWEDNEASFDDLRARLRKAIDYVGSFQPAQIDGSESRPISIPMRSGDALQFDGETFLKHFALGNFYFHTSATYMLLRQAGVELGKGDFLGR